MTCIPVTKQKGFRLLVILKGGGTLPFLLRKSKISLMRAYA